MVDVEVPSLRSVSCAMCAGPLQACDGDRLLRCNHCGTWFLLPVHGEYSRRYFPAKVDRLQAVGKASVWLGRHPDMPSDVNRSVFSDAQLVYVPIWEARAYVVGWEFGKKLRTRAEFIPAPTGEKDLFGEEAETLSLQLVDEGVQEAFFNERRMYQAAADLTAMGINRPHITGTEFTLPYLPGELDVDAAILEANDQHEEVLARAKETFSRPIAGVSTDDARLFLLRESMTLLYYPLWSLKYRYRGRLYEMFVDGRGGTVHSARGPADNRKRIALMIGSFALLAFLLAFGAWMWQQHSLSDVFLYSAFLVAAGAGGVFWRFGLLREVEYHEPFTS
jgi:hypothetical protein